MKSVLKNYTFNAAAKTITLPDIATVRLDRLALITDTTTNAILYNFADSTVSTATVATNVITLSTVGSASSSDKLRIDYEVDTTDAAFGDSTEAVKIVSPANNAYGQALATTNGATGTIANIASSPAGYKIIGFTGNGTGDGYWFVQVAGVTLFSGRTRSTLPTVSVILPNPITVSTASAVMLKVANESGSTADYEGTLLGQ